MKRSAYILFASENIVLTGLGRQGWSGIGGKLRKLETPARGAFREVLEELFSINSTLAANFICDTFLSQLTILIEEEFYTLFLLPYESIFEMADLLNDYMEWNKVRSKIFDAKIPTDEQSYFLNFKSKELYQIAKINLNDLPELPFNEFFLNDLKVYQNYMMKKAEQYTDPSWVSLEEENKE